VNVEVRLFANLAEYLPTGGRGSGAILTVPDGATVGEVLGILAIPAALPRLLLVNGADVDAEHRLAAGDVVSVLPPLVGGRA
jgi:molybdopterin converting factor small subunit